MSDDCSSAEPDNHVQVSSLGPVRSPVRLHRPACLRHRMCLEERCLLQPKCFQRWYEVSIQTIGEIIHLSVFVHSCEMLKKKNDISKTRWSILVLASGMEHLTIILIFITMSVCLDLSVPFFTLMQETAARVRQKRLLLKR